EGRSRDTATSNAATRFAEASAVSAFGALWKNPTSRRRDAIFRATGFSGTAACLRSGPSAFSRNCSASAPRFWRQQRRRWRPAGADRARLTQPGLSALGLLREHRCRRALPGQAHHGQTGRSALAADASPPGGALGGGVGHGEGYTRRGGKALVGKRIHLYPGRDQASTRKRGRG